MSGRDRVDKPSAPAPKPAPPVPGSRPARPNVEERGPTGAAWAAKTGMFDRFGSTQRVRKLVESAGELELVDTPRQDGRAFDPYARASAKGAAKPRTGEPAGGDPYSSGPARRPEDISFNPYARPRARKP